MTRPVGQQSKKCELGPTVTLAERMNSVQLRQEMRRLRGKCPRIEMPKKMSLLQIIE